jgi:3'(2'), 5'-bisphosphate nucleotidase
MQEELHAAKRLAVGAGSILMKYYQQSVEIDWKAPGDPVTAADREANDFIVSNLRREFPAYGVLSEEAADDETRLGQSHVWMVDPMDGTREFVEHRDEFSVMIGLVIDGIPAVGAVYQPTTRKLYYAAAGLGAFMEVDGATTPLHVSKESVADRLIMAASRSHRSARVDAICSALRIPETIYSGSVGLKVGLICEGRAHLYVHTGNKTHLWDTCAPEAILREAGGQFSDVTNQPLRYRDKDDRNLHGIIASNGVIHDRVVQVTQSVIELFDKKT